MLFAALQVGGASVASSVSTWIMFMVAQVVDTSTAVNTVSQLERVILYKKSKFEGIWQN